MRITKNPTLLCLLFFSFGPSLFARSQTPAEQADVRAALEASLRECPVASLDKSQSGRTSPWIITFGKDCAIQRALFRYVDRPRPQPMPDSYKYDIAAYELTKLLGIELIPPVVEREIGGRQGTLQILLENCIRERDRKRKKINPPDAKAFNNALEELNVFVNLAYDDCYNFDDIYIHQANWQVCRVDFSEAFYPSLELLPGCEITTCSKKLYKGLIDLAEEEVRETLGRYLSEEEITACLVRKKLILEKINALIAEKGEESVLF